MKGRGPEETPQLVLRRIERRYQTLAELSPVGIFHSDAAGHYSYVNERWCQITSLPADEARGDGWMSALTPADAERVVHEWQRVVRGGLVFGAEYRVRRRDGSVRWVLGQAFPETDPEAGVVGYMGTITDVTERKYADEYVRQSEERYRILFDHNPLPMWCTTRRPWASWR